MTPEEKAMNLLINMYNSGDLSTNEAKKCAIKAVDEIINANPHSNPLNTDVYSTINYWCEVKKQILLL